MVEPNEEQKEETFSGSELDEANEEQELPAEKEARKDASLDPAPEHPKGNDGNGPGKNRWLLVLLLTGGILGLAGAGYFYLQGTVLEKMPRGSKGLTDSVIRRPVPKQRGLDLRSFIIPLDGRSSATYLSLNVTIEAGEEVLAKKMIAKKRLLRGLIYDILRETVNRSPNLPGVKELEGLVKERVSRILGGKVKRAKISAFSVV